MKTQNVFKRYEIKYMLTEEQVKVLLAVMEPYMKLDKFGRSTIRNIYYDTPDFILARHSIAKPEFKEKLRVRSYEQTTDDSLVFVELKRKFDSVVYKRRLTTSNKEAESWLNRRTSAKSHRQEQEIREVQTLRQVGKEIDYFVDYYETLRPAAFLSYDREAYRMKIDGDEFRVTFDRNVIYRDYDLNLNSGVYGTELLEPGKVLMELKCPGGIPMWMVKTLSELRIYKTSFSKYGTAYRDMMQSAQAQALAKAEAAQAQKLAKAALENDTEQETIQDEKERTENEYTSRKHLRHTDSNINHSRTIFSGFGSGTRARTRNRAGVHA